MAPRPTPALFLERARAVTFRHPVFTTLTMQIGFWMVANAFFAVLIHLILNSVAIQLPQLRVMPLRVTVPMSLALAVVYGTVLGSIDLWMERRLDPDRAWGLRIMLKAVLYTAAFVVLTTGFLNVMGTIYERYYGGVTSAAGRRWLLLALLLYASMGNLAISVIKEVNRSFGPGLLRLLLLGSYRTPQVEHRIFMFMDLRGSTTHAEELGHLRYSAMVRDLFQDVNRVVPRFEAQIYQYVGDEVVFAWNEHRGADALRCLQLYFAVQDAITARADVYQERYGTVPGFKAGVHVGIVTAVEIGDIKREIAYHGDTINTAARIQSMSNSFGRSLLVSEEMLRLCGDLAPVGLRGEPLGSILLRGKRNEVAIHAVERIGQDPLP